MGRRHQVRKAMSGHTLLRTWVVAVTTSLTRPIRPRRDLDSVSKRTTSGHLPCGNVRGWENGVDGHIGCGAMRNPSARRTSATTDVPPVISLYEGGCRRLRSPFPPLGCIDGHSGLYLLSRRCICSTRVVLTRGGHGVHSVPVVCLPSVSFPTADMKQT